MRFALSTLGATLSIVFVLFIMSTETKAQFPSGTCVVEFVTSTVGAKQLTKQTCENRTKFTAPAFTGVPCAVPADGIVLYAQLADGTCLPITAVAATGFIADNFQVLQAIDEEGTLAAQRFYSRLTPSK